ncbi:GLG1 (predicted), partial [Pycnogonum litorale]
ENAIHEDKEISSQCESEIIDHRRMLMRDYRLSPQLTMLCQKDIENFCGNKLELGGKTLHCLMEHSDKTKKHHVSEKCRVQLEDLMKIVDVGEDWRVDPVLHEACQPVVSVACKDVNDGEGRVLSCLMDHLDSDHMLEECRDKLLQIQYFIARDYKLDTRLYKACKKNAVKFCHAKDVWWDDPENMDPERGPLILPCLYRYAYHPMKEMRLSGQCLGEVKRVMRQRAVSVHLHPEIEEPCLADLSEHCVNRMYPGQELSCLQEHLDELSEPCRMAVGNYTELEADNMELNYELSKVCDSVFKRYCSDLLSGDIDEGKLLQCLIDNKNKHDVKLNVKCHAAIEHFQLITLKDYRFSPKFQQHCRSDVIKYCPSIKSKAEVISCLSEIHTEDILKDTKPPRLAEECQLQLRVDQFIMNEDVRFDPELQMACSHDQKKFCEDVTSGEAKVIECLKSHLHDLSDSCHKHIFKKEKEEMADNAIDYTLIKSCKSMIKQFCPNEDFSQVLTCLKHHQDEEDMNEVCRKEIIRRKIMQSKDYRLNPDLQHSCIKDIPKFCSKEMAMATDEELEGKVILCLKEQFRKHRLSMECEKEIQILVKESALDYRQDPVLMEACESEISRLCSEEKGWEGQGRVEECLKRK